MKKKSATVIIFTLLVSISYSQTGLYMRTQFWSSQLEISWLYFTSDKKVIRNPKFGVNPLQLEREIAENAKNIATITSSSSDKMSLHWGDGKKHVINVEFKNGILTAFDGGICTKPSSFSFKFFQDKTYSGLANFGNVTRSVIMFLGKDGNFSNDRVGAVSGSGNLTGVAAVKVNESGSYSITGNTIIFRYKDGKEWRAVAQPYDMGKEEVIIGDQLFKKIEPK